MARNIDFRLGTDQDPWRKRTEYLRKLRSGSARNCPTRGYLGLAEGLTLDIASRAMDLDVVSSLN